MQSKCMQDLLASIIPSVSNEIILFLVNCMFWASWAVGGYIYDVTQTECSSIPLGKSSVSLRVRVVWNALSSAFAYRLQ